MKRHSILFSTLAFSFTLLTAQVAATTTETKQEIRVQSTETQNGVSVGSSVKHSNPLLSQTDAKKAAHQKKQLSSPKVRPVGVETRSLDPDFWIFDAYVTFDADQDYDGYYSSFTVEFDADTYYDSAEVYARLYLSRGTVFEEYHTSSLFFIHGDSSSDSLVVHSDLVTGFPPGDYELLIELYDAYDDKLVAVYDGYNDADLTLLTLESQSYEESTVVITTEHGGSLGFLALLFVPVLIYRMRRV